MDTAAPAIEIGLNAVIVAVTHPTPLVLTIDGTAPGEPESLPFGPFDPLHHRTFEIGLRAWVEQQTELRLGYVEQLYTYGDRGRHAQPGDEGPHVVSVGYLALARQSPESEIALERARARWRPWYDYFPWEDWRQGRPALLDDAILPALDAWAAAPKADGDAARAERRQDRLRLSFGGDGNLWDEERALERYELCYEAGLLAEAERDGRPLGPGLDARPYLGREMQHDHRRILATAITRLRGKLKYRPVIFELMPAVFTLTELQRTVEAISGRHLHKQNFRRLVETTELVEPTGATTTRTGGRPAALFRFRRQVLRERPAPGLRVGVR
ncbi:NAD regulator [Breoghania sp. JC706]|uniref:NUDIX hydrolase n=1 Tax=Breoghania sp. JC706 TaxID=3117732 RepID=UPI0030098535